MGQFHRPSEVGRSRRRNGDYERTSQVVGGTTARRGGLWSTLSSLTMSHVACFTTAPPERERATGWSIPAQRIWLPLPRSGRPASGSTACWNWWGRRLCPQHSGRWPREAAWSSWDLIQARTGKSTPGLIYRNEWEILGSRNVTVDELATVAALVDNGRIRPIVAGLHPLEDAEILHQRVLDGAVVGRDVLLPNGEFP